MDSRIVSVRDNPEYFERAVEYFSRHWPVSRAVYEDAIRRSIDTPSPLPRWYLLQNEQDTIIGCYGLITNDFNSRQDLWPWICGLHVEETERGQGHGGAMLAHGIAEAMRLGFSKVYLATDHVGYYEKYGFTYIGQCYETSGEAGRVYICQVLQ